MHVSVHIYKHLAFFFICCKVLSPFFILTLLDHVVLVSSASTTNTREIKNRFRLERRSPSRSTKIVNSNKRLDFFGFSHVFFLIFCLWFFVYCFSLLSLIGFFFISIRKSTITYIWYINVSIVSFVCCFYTQYLYILSGGASRSTGADCDRALQILGYGFHLRHTVLKVHR